MAKQKRQNIMEREQNRKGNGTISKVQLYSCYAASALIAVICVLEAMKPETQASGNPSMYYFLAVLGIAFSVYITIRNNGAKKKENHPTKLR